MVVPILAPMITLIASGRDSRAALEKLTTIRVVALDDWMTEVIIKPVATPNQRLEVMVASMALIRPPASNSRASLITFIPKRKSPSEPNKRTMSAKP